MKKPINLSPLILPLPTVLVGTYDEDNTPDAMTAAWVSPCSKAPPCIGVAIRQSRQTYRNIQLKKAFSINIPFASQAMETDYLGIVSAKTTPNKIAKSGLTTCMATKIAAPIIVECPINIECRLENSLEIGTHVWVIGQVVYTQVDETILTADGTIDDDGFCPLGYMGVSKHYVENYTLGAPAFQVGKKLKQP